MNMFKINLKQTPYRTCLWVALCLSLVVSACATLEPTKPEDQIRQRATERWQALVKGEFIRAYSYNTPAFRAVITADGFRNRFGGSVTWLGAEVVGVNCKEEISRCVATIKLEFKHALTVRKTEPMVNFIDETWLFDQGQWWFFQKI